MPYQTRLTSFMEFMDDTCYSSVLSQAALKIGPDLGVINNLRQEANDLFQQQGFISDSQIIPLYHALLEYKGTNDIYRTMDEFYAQRLEGNAMSVNRNGIAVDDTDLACTWEEPEFDGYDPDVHGPLASGDIDYELTYSFDTFGSSMEGYKSVYTAEVFDNDFQSSPVTVAMGAILVPYTGEMLASGQFGTEGDDTIIATASDDFVDAFSGNDEIFAGGGNDVVDAGAGNDIVTGGAGDDLIFLQGGGDDSVDAGAGNDGIFFGSAFNANDTVDGGGGDADQIALQGDYSAGLTFGVNSTVGIEEIVLLSDDLDTGPLDYDLTLIDANIGAGQQLTFQANELQAAEDFTLDASAELDGSIFTFGGLGDEDLTGSQQSDAFFFGTDRFTSADVIDGQGGFDAIGLQGDYSGGLQMSDGQLTDIEILALLSASDTRFGATGASDFSYDLTLADGNLSAGDVLTLVANALGTNETLTLDGSAELDGMLNVFSGNGDDSIAGSQGGDTISGLGGSDSLTGEDGDDVFLYVNLTDSTASAMDHILDFTSGDLIDLSSLDADTGSAGNDAFAFIGAASFSAAGQLRAVNTSGNDWMVEADVDGDAIADFALALTTSDGGSITAGDFLA